MYTKVTTQFVMYVFGICERQAQRKIKEVKDNEQIKFVSHWQFINYWCLPEPVYKEYKDKNRK